MPHHRPAEPDIQRYYTEVFAEADRRHATPRGRLEARRTRDLLARLLPDGSADATLLLGPLYHLTGAADRVAALREAARLTRPGGPVVAAVISRNAPLIDLTAKGRVDPGNRPLLRAAYASGVNDPETGFTTAYFHGPEQVVAEFRAAGLPAPAVYGVEGPLWPLLNALGTGPEEPLFADAVVCAETVEQDPAVFGTSAHLLGVAFS
ncbi:class I SAM-dependent methyltransferase [Micromonospora sp. NPDC050495]|uniref:class I SAM-dependent methyltransferase n=1 Tax=Micromonospora sp. NPDC050495 TaxID=3154936 RepID=UPI0033ECE06C